MVRDGIEKHLVLQDKDASSRYALHFDGAYMNTSVYVNSQLVGTRPYGFISFSFDLTPYLNKQGDNVIAVRLITPSNLTVVGTQDVVFIAMSIS